MDFRLFIVKLQVAHLVCILTENKILRDILLSQKHPIFYHSCLQAKENVHKEHVFVCIIPQKVLPFRTNAKCYYHHHRYYNTTFSSAVVV